MTRDGSRPMDESNFPSSSFAQGANSAHNQFASTMRSEDLDAYPSIIKSSTPMISSKNDDTHRIYDNSEYSPGFKLSRLDTPSHDKKYSQSVHFTKGIPGIGKSQPQEDEVVVYRGTRIDTANRGQRPTDTTHTPSQLFSRLSSNNRNTVSNMAPVAHVPTYSIADISLTPFRKDNSLSRISKLGADLHKLATKLDTLDSTLNSSSRK
jgi:hypothetical protein